MPPTITYVAKWKSEKKYSHALACAYLEYKCYKGIPKYGKTPDESHARIKRADFTNDTIELLRRMLLCPEWQTSLEALKKFQISSDIKVVAGEVKQMLDHYGEDLILIKENHESIKLCQSKDNKSIPNGAIRGAGAVKREIGLNITAELFYLWFGADNEKYTEVGPDLHTFAQTWGSGAFGELTEDNKTTLEILIKTMRYYQVNVLLSFYINKIQEPGILDNGTVHSKNIEVTLRNSVPMVSYSLCHLHRFINEKEESDRAIFNLMSIKNEMIVQFVVIRTIDSIKTKALELKIEIDANIKERDKLEVTSIKRGSDFLRLWITTQQKQAKYDKMLAKIDELGSGSENFKKYLNNLNSCEEHKEKLELIRIKINNCLLCISRIMQFRATFDLLELSACGTRKSPDDVKINVLQFAYLLGGEDFLGLLISCIKDEHIPDTQANPVVYRSRKKDEVIKSASEMKKIYGIDAIEKLIDNIAQLIYSREESILTSALRTSSCSPHNREHSIAILPELPRSGSPTHLKHTNDEAVHKSEKLRRPRPSQPPPPPPPPPPKPEIRSELAKTESHGKVDANSNISAISNTQLTSCVTYCKLKSNGSECSVMQDDPKQKETSNTGDSTSLPTKTGSEFKDNYKYCYIKVVFWSLLCISFACLMVANAVEMVALCEPQPNLYICKYTHHSLVKCTEIYNYICEYFDVFSDLHLGSPECMSYLITTLLLFGVGCLGSFFMTINAISFCNIRDIVIENGEILFELKKEEKEPPESSEKISPPESFIADSYSLICSDLHNQPLQNAHKAVF